MHLAACYGHKEVVQLLLEGADREARDNVGLGGRDIYLSLRNGT